MAESLQRSEPTKTSYRTVNFDEVITFVVTCVHSMMLTPNRELRGTHAFD